MLKMTRWVLVLISSFAIPMISMADDKPTKSGKTDIVRTAAAAGKFKTLLNALITADLLETLQKGDGPFTVFAPTDEAFAKLPIGTLETLFKPENKKQLTNILTYHVVKGKFSSKELINTPSLETLNGIKVHFSTSNHKLRVNSSTVVIKDIECRNGIVHVIDTVLLPTTENESKNTIIQVASTANKFKILLDALKAAELKEVLEGAGPFTVFAPTDEAFGKLPSGTIEKLIKPENRRALVSILKYHVIAGKVTAKDAVIAEKAKTLQGSSVKASIKDGKLTINEATVIGSDVLADNGIIHIIDKVLLPPTN